VLLHADTRTDRHGETVTFISVEFVVNALETPAQFFWFRLPNTTTKIKWQTADAEMCED